MPDSTVTDPVFHVMDLTMYLTIHQLSWLPSCLAGLALKQADVGFIACNFSPMTGVEKAEILS